MFGSLIRSLPDYEIVVKSVSTLYPQLFLIGTLTFSLAFTVCCVKVQSVLWDKLSPELVSSLFLVWGLLRLLRLHGSGSHTLASSSI